MTLVCPLRVQAANEMKERLEGLLGEAAAAALNAGTFHSLCHRILRRPAHLARLPLDKRNSLFSVYDDDASLGWVHAGWTGGVGCRCRAPALFSSRGLPLPHCPPSEFDIVRRPKCLPSKFEIALPRHPPACSVVKGLVKAAHPDWKVRGPLTTRGLRVCCHSRRHQQ